MLIVFWRKLRDRETDGEEGCPLYNLLYLSDFESRECITYSYSKNNIFL